MSVSRLRTTCPSPLANDALIFRIFPLRSFVRGSLLDHILRSLQHTKTLFQLAVSHDRKCCHAAPFHRLHGFGAPFFSLPRTLTSFFFRGGWGLSPTHGILHISAEEANLSKHYRAARKSPRPHKCRQIGSVGLRRPTHAR